MMQSAFLFRCGFRAFSLVAPARAAAATSAWFRRPALTAGLDADDSARMELAGALMDRGVRGETRIARRRLRHYHFRARGRPRGLALLLHGWSGDARAMAAFPPALTTAGFDALAVDLPAHGGSCGEDTDAVEAAALVDALLARLGLSPGHLIGHSYGGAVAALLVARGLAPRTATLIAAPSHLDLVLEEVAEAFGLSRAARDRFAEMTAAQLGRPGEAFDALPVWSRSGAAVLALHGPDDARVSFAHARRLAAAPNVRLVPLPGPDHCAIVHDPRAIRAALAHIEAECAAAIPATPRASAA